LSPLPASVFFSLAVPDAFLSVIRQADPKRGGGKNEGKKELMEKINTRRRKQTKQERKKERKSFDWFCPSTSFLHSTGSDRQRRESRVKATVA